jgi:bacteriorhodopsin
MDLPAEKWMHAAFFGGLLCAWISLWLMGRMWLVHRQDSVGKRLMWSMIVCIPFFGWLAYGGFYKTLAENKVRASSNPDVMAGH